LESISLISISKLIRGFVDDPSILRILVGLTLSALAGIFCSGGTWQCSLAC
jgi:hypothetical protein